MDYFFCKKCDKLYIKRRLTRGKCEECRGPCEIISVRRSVFAYLMGLMLVAAGITAVFYRLQDDRLYLAPAFLFIILGFYFAYKDLIDTEGRAREKAREIEDTPEEE